MATDAELAEIRDQIKQMKESYEARIRALKDRVKAAESSGKKLRRLLASTQGSLLAC